MESKLFEWVLRNASDDYCDDDYDDYCYDDCGEEPKIKLSNAVFSEPLSGIFDSVLNSCEHENSVDYTSVTVNKRSTPLNRRSK
jgi:hypothetical protein